MSAKKMPRGVIMADVVSCELTPDDKNRLLDPNIGGVILFRRNFQNKEQLKKLCSDIKSLREPELIIAVDHEGGRVQRFIHGFTRLPAMSVLGTIWDTQGSNVAQSYAEKVGWVLATELRACGIDLSFTPVLDLNWNTSEVIGDRSFHRLPEIVSTLALALQRGLQRGGMKSCAKHFPGHGFAVGDSHHTLPIDSRDFDQINQNDIIPFARLIENNLAAIMPAYVLYPQVDKHTAGFSYYWLQTILRKHMNFQGVIFSDDLTMEGANSAGDKIHNRAQAALEAGCDIVLVCNRPDLVDELCKAFKLPEMQKTLSIATQNLAHRWENITNTLPLSEAEAIMKTDDFIQAQQLVASLSRNAPTLTGVAVGEAY